MSNYEFVKLDTYHRREKILDTAAELFAEYGYDSVTTIQLAEAVGCSESSIFQIFSSKDQIYEALFREWENTVKVLPQIRIEDNSALKTLRKLFNSYRTRTVSLHKDMRPRLESAVYSRRTKGYIRKIHEILRQQPDMASCVLAPIFAYGQQTGEIRPGDPVVQATVFWSCIWGQKELWYDESYQMPFQSFQYIFTKM